MILLHCAALVAPGAFPPRQPNGESAEKGRKKSPNIYQKLAGEQSGALLCVEMAFLGLAVKLKRYQALFGMDTLSLISAREMGEIICFYSDCLAERGGLEAPPSPLPSLAPCPLHPPFQGAKLTLWALSSGSHMENLLHLIPGRDSEHQSFDVITLPRSQSMDNKVGIEAGATPPFPPGIGVSEGRRLRNRLNPALAMPGFTPGSAPALNPPQRTHF